MVSEDIGTQGEQRGSSSWGGGEKRIEVSGPRLCWRRPYCARPGGAPPSSGSLAAGRRQGPVPVRPRPRALALVQTSGRQRVTDTPTSAADDRVPARARLATDDGEPPCARRSAFGRRRPRPRTCSPCCSRPDAPSLAGDDRVPARARLATATGWEAEGGAVEEPWRRRGAAARECGRERIGETHTRVGIGLGFHRGALVLSAVATPLASSRRGTNNSLSQTCGPART